MAAIYRDLISENKPFWAYFLFGFGFDNIKEEIGEFFTGKSVVPGNDFAVYGDAAAFFVAIINALAIDEE